MLGWSTRARASAPWAVDRDCWTKVRACLVVIGQGACVCLVAGLGRVCVLCSGFKVDQIGWHLPGNGHKFLIKTWSRLFPLLSFFYCRKLEAKLVQQCHGRQRCVREKWLGE
jgi:hypothetical protein